MRKFVSLASTTLIAAGTGWITFGQPDFVRAEDAAMSAKAESKDMAGAQADTMAARRTLAKATEAALSDNPVQNLSECLAASDRDRIRSGNVDVSQLNQTVTTLKNDFRAKYGSDFSISDPNVALDHTPKAGDDKPKPMNVTMGAENRAPARMDAAPNGDYTTRGLAGLMGGGAGAGTDAGARDNAGASARVDTGKTATDANAQASAGGNTAAGGVNTAGTDERSTSGLPAQNPAAEGVQRNSDSSRMTANTTVREEADRAQTAAGTVAPANTGADVNANVNTNAGTGAAGGAMAEGKEQKESFFYTIPAGHGANIDTLKMVNEGGDWKIDIDDSIDGNKLAANLNKHLTKVNEMKDQWPTEATEAQRVISHHVAAALNDTSR
jgi:hypothetical protein